MNKCILEDWVFTVEVVDGNAKNCRLGLETGDTFCFEYETPQGFCPRALSEIFTWCEVIRCGGDFTYRGAKEKFVMGIQKYTARNYDFIGGFSRFWSNYLY